MKNDMKNLIFECVVTEIDQEAAFVSLICLTEDAEREFAEIPLDKLPQGIELGSVFYWTVGPEISEMKLSQHGWKYTESEIKDIQEEGKRLFEKFMVNSTQNY